MERRLIFPEVRSDLDRSVAAELTGRFANEVKDLVNKSYKSRMYGESKPQIWEQELGNGTIRVFTTPSPSDLYGVKSDICIMLSKADKTYVEMQEKITDCDFGLYRELFSTLKKFILLCYGEEVTA